MNFHSSTDGHLTKAITNERDEAVHFIGVMVRQARERSSITRVMLASNLGVSVNQLYRYELGKDAIRLNRLADICCLIGYPLDYIVFEYVLFFYPNKLSFLDFRNGPLQLNVMPDATFDQRIGSLLRSVRRIRGISVPAVSYLTGINNGQLFKYEVGKYRLCLYKYVIICLALNIRPDILIRNL